MSQPYSPQLDINNLVKEYDDTIYNLAKENVRLKALLQDAMNHIQKIESQAGVVAEE